MQIDWLTVSAQLVNFLILIWLLKRFLYRPVMNAMARREQDIAARLAEANDRERLADGREQLYSDKAAELDQARAQFLSDARDAAEQERLRLLDEARRDTELQRNKWSEQLEREREDFGQAIKQELTQAAAHIARRALVQLADASLEQQILSAFLKRLETLPHKAREPFVEGAQTLHLTSAFDLDAQTQETARATIEATLGAPIKLAFTRNHALVCGIELSSAGHKLSWNLADFVGDFEERIRRVVAESPAARSPST